LLTTHSMLTRTSFYISELSLLSLWISFLFPSFSLVWPTNTNFAVSDCYFPIGWDWRYFHTSLWFRFGFWLTWRCWRWHWHYWIWIIGHLHRERNIPSGSDSLFPALQKLLLPLPRQRLMAFELLNARLNFAYLLAAIQFIIAVYRRSALPRWFCVTWTLHGCWMVF
jgi:hypothetical protein